MLAATDTPWAPWFVVGTDDKKRGRLNLISHLLTYVPYTPLKSREIVLPKRKVATDIKHPGLPLKHIPTPY
jgi:polyphosphate kinase